MKKKVLLIFAAIAALLLVVGGATALNAKPSASDVSKPTVTPDANTVKYHVLGTSMDPTIKDGDWLLAKIDVKKVERGQVIILRYPKDETKVYCRRVVAVAGDRVVMRYYPSVKITTIYSAQHPEGVVFPEGAKAAGNVYGEYETKVETGTVYVVGDNTVPGGSFDSDEWGLLPVANVAGVVTRRLEPNPTTF